MNRAALRYVAVVTLALFSGACSGGADDDSRGAAERETPEAPSGSATSVEVALEPYKITPEPAEAPAGAVTFELTSTGPTHNFLVIKTELAPGDLPVFSDAGPVDTEGDGVEVAGLVPIPFRGEKELRVDLGAGDYVLICNAEAHYVRGMRTRFKVV